MSVTVDIDENQNIRVTDENIETDPPDRIAFAVQGVVTMTEELLGRFEGMSLRPVRTDMSANGSQTVEIDLTEGASLRLDDR